mmetsp:Transcript_17926/g.44454  ORF Transcript_17926/g.44454 Transcript_17926/m.44454 type:complete len:357 (-) Transcript_17926:662-1732(-)
MIRRRAARRGVDRRVAAGCADAVFSTSASSFSFLCFSFFFLSFSCFLSLPSFFPSSSRSAFLFFTTVLSALSTTFSFSAASPPPLFCTSASSAAADSPFFSSLVSSPSFSSSSVRINSATSSLLLFLLAPRRPDKRRDTFLSGSSLAAASSLASASLPVSLSASLLSASPPLLEPHFSGETSGSLCTLSPLLSKAASYLCACSALNERIAVEGVIGSMPSALLARTLRTSSAKSSSRGCASCLTPVSTFSNSSTASNFADGDCTLLAAVVEAEEEGDGKVRGGGEDSVPAPALLLSIILHSAGRALRITTSGIQLRLSSVGRMPSLSLHLLIATCFAYALASSTEASSFSKKLILL